MASNSRGTSDSRVDLPEPVLPMMAVVLARAGAEGDVPQHRVVGTRVAERDAAAARTVPRVATSVSGSTGGTTDDSVSSTSVSRSAQTAARGTRTSMKVAIMIDMRICMR